MARGERFCCFTTVLLVALVVGTAAYGLDAVGQPGPQKQVPEYFYIHFGVGGDMVVVDSGDIGAAMEPLEVGAVGFGYSYYVHGGIRNIIQVEYRKGKAGNSMFYDEMGYDYGINRTTIEMDHEYSEVLFKVNPIFFAYKSKTWAFFLVWGDGDVEYVDMYGDGFVDGRERIHGVEVVAISKYLDVGASVERHSMTFHKFAIAGVGEVPGIFQSSYLQFRVFGSVGFGI